ncbi:hypothetical protein [Rheinheimera sp. 1928-s]|uniref:hypothetical protein n=1 Tax=Rheinheimera sp. 1928-s TaxID=3033803 RepID=UPI002626750D|nr:hypothetical protein [Rheinheimera sp. 1928-s]MDF3125227.1 hypothetical protein [Rheinheimera sp. 1928-s]
MLDAIQQQYLNLADVLLQQRYAITLKDTGYDGLEWLARFGDQPVEDAVTEYAAKYDLIPTSTVCQY